MSDAIKVVTKQIEIAGITFDAYQLPNGEYRVSLGRFASAFRAEDIQIKRGLKGDVIERKVLCGEGLKGDRETALLSPLQMTTAAGYLAGNNNKLALAFLIATSTETVERRLDKVFGVYKTEEVREETTKENYTKLKDWLDNREDLRSFHTAFQNICLLYHVPAAHAHDRITKAITGMTAANARQLPVVDGDETIGLNHQPEETPENLLIIAEVKAKFANMKRRKSETWQEMVDRAITAVVAP